MKDYYVYILSNKTRTTFYIGVTNDLQRRMFEHTNRVSDSFSKKYNLNKLLYFEQATDINSAIAREKQLKNWHREWKLNLIRTMNPDLKDLDADL